jgi:UPF0755 protein
VSKRSFRGALIVVVVTLVALAGGAAWAVMKVIHYPDRRHPGRGREVVVTIQKDWRFTDDVQALVDAGVIDHPMWFRLSFRAQASRVRPGAYTLRDDMTPREIMAAIVKGVKEPDVPVTILEGTNLHEVEEAIAAAGIATAAELDAVARDPAWLKEQGIDGATAEGYLFPDTYRWKKPTPAKQVLETMVKQHRIVYGQLESKHKTALEALEQKLKWGDREIVVLASLVEKESQEAGARAKVASVFVNRLTWSSFKSHRLETDPTIRYGCEMIEPKTAGCAAWDASGPLHRAQLDDEANPYNTYRHAGLPPGPIANPGRAALEAAMAPASTEYLFFVAKDGVTHFAETEDEQNANEVKFGLKKAP